MATQYIVHSGEVQNVPEGVTASMSYVYDGGTLILNGGGGIFTNVLAGGIESVLDKSTEEQANIYGNLVVSSGGLALSVQIHDGGTASVEDGATLRFARVNVGGSAVVSSGGCASGGNVFGKLEILNGGIAKGNNTSGSGPCVNGGLMTVAGAANDPVISAGGTLEILSGGYTFRPILSGSLNIIALMTVFSSGSANSATIKEGGSCLVKSGASMYNAIISSGGTMTIESGGEVRSVTKIDGGLFQMAEGELIVSSRSDPEHSGASMLISNGGKASVAAMTIQDGALVTVDSKSTLQFQTITKETGGTFALANLDSYDSKTGTCRKVLDCTAETPLSEADYKTLLGLADFSGKLVYSDGDLYMRGAAVISSEADGAESFATIESAMALNPTGFVIKNGTFMASSNVPTFHGLETTIKGGAFGTSVCGGEYVNATGPGSEFVDIENGGDISLTVDGGMFTKIFFAGDRVGVPGAVERTGSITTTINGGDFHTAVAGAMAYTYGAGGNTDGITLVGDVNLTIKGGNFYYGNIPGGNQNKDWIYGGCLSTTKALAAKTTIQGNVTVTLDASARDVTIGNLVAGSYGEGVIEAREGVADSGNTRLVVKGGTNTSVITATGEIWGGCSGDRYAVSGYITTVDGNRTLSFTGFQGELKCDKIRAFNYAEFVKIGTVVTSATLNNNTASGNSLDMGYVENWTFENGCSLSGNFKNDFADDKLNLMGVISGETVDWTILTNTNEAGFSNFNGMEVYLNGSLSSKGVIADNALAWSDSGINYTLALDGGVLSLHGVAAATVA